MFLTDDVDTRAITRRLREDGSLIGVLSTDQSQTDNELLEMAKKWKIVGMLKLHQTAMLLKDVTSFLCTLKYLSPLMDLKGHLRYNRFLFPTYSSEN
jgi:hypothetical protein